MVSHPNFIASSIENLFSLMRCYPAMLFLKSGVNHCIPFVIAKSPGIGTTKQSRREKAGLLHSVRKDNAYCGFGFL